MQKEKRKKRVFSLVLAFVMLTGLLPLHKTLEAQEPEPGETIFAADFDDYEGSETEKVTPRGMGMGQFAAGENYAEGDAEVFGKSANSIRMHTMTPKKFQIYKAINDEEAAAEPRLAFEASVRFNDTKHERHIFSLNKNKFGNDPYFVIISFREDGSITLGAEKRGKAVETSLSYEADTWYHIKAFIDLEAGSFALYLNGEAVPESRELVLNERWTQTNYFRLIQIGDAAEPAIMHVDDLKVYSYTQEAESTEESPETEESSEAPEESEPSEPTETSETTEPGEPDEPAEPTEPSEETEEEGAALPPEDPSDPNYIEYFRENFDRFSGRTESDGGSVKVSGMKAYNVANDENYIEAVTAPGREDISAGFFVKTSDVKNGLNLTKENFEPLIEGKAVLKAKLYFSDTAHEREAFQLRNLKGPKDKVRYTGLFSFTDDGRILLSGRDTGERYAAETWYEAAAFLDLSAGTAEYFLNGKAITAEGAAQLKEGFESIYSLKFIQRGKEGTESVMYLDDIVVYGYEDSSEAGGGEEEAEPTPTPDPEEHPYIEYFTADFNNYVGPTVSSGGSVKVDEMKSFNVVNGENYLTDVLVDPKTDKSLGFYSNVADPNGKALNLTKENFQPLLSGKLVLEAELQFEDTEHEREIFQLRDIGKVQGQSPKYRTLFKFDESGRILLNKRSSKLRYEAGKWYKVGALLDLDAGTARYFLDGKEITAPGAETLGEDFNSVFSIKFTQKGKDSPRGVMYLDNIRLYAGTIFREKPDISDLPVDKTVLGWDVQTISGEALVEAGQSPYEGEGEVIRLKLNDKGDQPLLRKIFDVTPGENYMVNTWLRVETDASINFLTEVKPLDADGKVMQKDGEDIVFLSHNNTRGSAIGSERLKVRNYFRAPEGCSAVEVRHFPQGAAEILILSSELEKKLGHEEAIGHYDSAGVSHPFDEGILEMFCGWQLRAFKNETEAERREAVAGILEMTDAELRGAARENQAARTHMDIHPEYEAHIRRLAQLYQQDKDEELARKAILIMLEFADGYNDVPRILVDNDLFHAHGKYIPMEALYAYDLLYNSPQWEQLSAESGRDMRAAAEGWFKAAFMNLYNFHDDVYYSNITPYGIRNAMGLAVVLNDPDIVRLIIPWMDAMLSGRQFHADGMWQEGAISYGMQVVNNINAAVKLLERYFVDPPGYEDTALGLRLDHTDLSPRWPLLEKSLRLNDVFRYVNGDRVALHDSWAFGQKNGDYVYDHNDPILEEYLRNAELWHFGHFSLVRGDTEEAMQVNLTFPPMSEGLPYKAGHYHGNHLGITLWGAGIEALPDSGYPKGNNRYFNMDTQSHNTGWVWNQDAEDYKEQRSLWTRPSVLAYDDGALSGKEVQLIEASSLGPEADQTAMKRRLLLMVGTNENRSYVLDLQRLQGGQAHELFMHASEDEHCSLQSDLALTAHEGTMQDYIASTGNTAGLKKYRDMFRDPQSASGAEDFFFSWTGEDSGSTLNVHMNGVPGSEAVFSTMPTNRRTQNKNKRMDDYPNWHFYRRNLVSPSEITRYGAVYETFRAGQEAKVKSVEWTAPENADAMTAVARVTLDGFTDIIYISNDSQERQYEDIRFAGKTAVLRLDDKGEVLWAYVYGEGKVEKDDFLLEGEDDLSYLVRSTESAMPDLSGSSDARGKENCIRVNEPLPSGRDFGGVWMRTEFTDGSGYAMRIERVNGEDLIVHDVPPFTILPNGAKMDYFPSVYNPEDGYLNLHAGDQELYADRIIPGEVLLEIRSPAFKRAEPVEPTEPSGSTEESEPVSPDETTETTVPEETTAPEETTMPEETTEAEATSAADTSPAAEDETKATAEAGTTRSAEQSAETGDAAKTGESARRAAGLMIIAVFTALSLLLRRRLKIFEED